MGRATKVTPLNEMIDRNNIRGRDTWACVVHVIHERQGTGPVWAGGGERHALPCVA